jgi:Fingers domain of DNA polymerase lambda
MEIINTGKLKRIDYERTELTVVSEIFRQIYGVGRCMCSEGMSHLFSIGPHLATRWYCLGLRTLDDVAKEKFGIKLTAAQKVCAHPHGDAKGVDMAVPRRLVLNTMTVCTRRR